jgi:hypothetical protein
MNHPLKILFKFPCRGREKVFFESLDSLNDNIRDKQNYLISLTIDVDDAILNTPEVVERINEYPNTEIQWGYSKSKIHAINRSMPEYDWDIIICWSNDQFATFYGFDDIMRMDILNKWGNNGLDGLAHFPEPDTKDILNVLYIATRKYYERFNYIYHPSYQSLWCDNESMLVAKALGKYHFFGTTGLYVHKNPAYSHHKMERDELFDQQQGLWQVDEDNFQKRKANNFDLHLIQDK